MFKFVKDGGNVNLVPLKNYDKCRIFIKSSTPDGTIHNYKKLELKDFNTESYLEITSGEVITAQLDGYVESHNLNNGDYMSVMYVGMTGDQYDETDKLHFSQSLKEKKSLTERYVMLGIPVNIRADELEHNFWSPAKRIGIRKTHYFTKGYGWGWALEYGHTSLRFGNEANRLDSLAAMDDDVRWLDKKVTQHKLNLGEFGIEIYQRVRLRPGGIFHKGWHWDIGVYGNWSYNAYILKGEHNGDIAATRKQTLRSLDLLDDYRWNWGVTTRLTRDWLGIYARYRLNDLNKDVPVGQFILPQLEAGIQFAF